MRNHHRKILDEDGQPPRRTASPSDPLLSPNTSTATTLRPYRQTTLGFDSSMALTALVLLTVLFFMVFFSLHLRRFASSGNISALELSSRRRRQQQQQRRRNSSSSSSSSSQSSTSSSFSSSQGLDPLTVKSLPLFAYDGNAKEPIDCVVCLSEFEERETVKMIPYCGHLFHPECIDMWFSSHVSCPLCRSTRLFRSSSVKKKKNDSLEKEKGFDLEQAERESRVERSTVMSGDMCIDQLRGRMEEEEEEEESWGGIRKSSSWSGLGEKVLLTRSLSF